MVYRTDILLNNNDVVISNNDLFLNESDNQHIIDTINANPGWWKENFSDGVGVVNYLKGRGIEQELARKIKLNLQGDGYNSQPIISFNSIGQLQIQTNVTV